MSAFGPHRSRYWGGLDKTRLQHLLTAAAMNLTRLSAWLTDPPVLQLAFGQRPSPHLVITSRS
ncbi:hypothetical protein [Saccharopolyspora spinosa]|uniref:hypothetical protein n=1 Tax=Saccharopolyspora spinosa TaxID=60894 RepID=UPI003749ABCE